jgi:hypothetical protein
MSAREQAAELKQQAIEVLLKEQDLIRKELLEMGYDQENIPAGKRRGRRAKLATESDVTVTDDILVEKVDE